MKKRLIISILSINMFISIGVLMPMRLFAADSGEKAYVLSKEDCKKISERLGEQITGGSQSIDDNLRVFGFGCEFTNNYRKGYWGGYASKLFEDIRIVIVGINFRRYETPKAARDDVFSMMENDSKNKRNRTDILFAVRETPDGYSAVLKDLTDTILRGFQTTYSGTVKIVRGSCLMSVTGNSFVEDDGAYRYHEYDIKKEKLIDKHPGFNHDREAEMLALARAKAIELFNILDCGNGVSSSSSTNPSAGNSSSKSDALNKSKYTQALVIEPPKEGDFKKVKPSDFKIVYPQNIPLAASKPATQSSSITGSIFIGKVGGEGQISIDIPNGEIATLSGDLTAFDGKISKWRLVKGGDKPLRSPRLLEISIYEQDCHFVMQQANQAAKASDWSGNNVITKTVGDCSYINEDGSVRVLSEQGNIALKTPAELSISAGKADFGVSYDISTGKSIVEIYNGSVKITNKSGQSKIISTVYGSEIKRIETNKDEVMTEKTAIPQSQWEAFLASQQKEKEIQTNQNNLVIGGAVAVLGIGGLILFLYKTGRLIPFYKISAQKILELTKKFGKNNKG